MKTSQSSFESITLSMCFYTVCGVGQSYTDVHTNKNRRDSAKIFTECWYDLFFLSLLILFWKCLHNLECKNISGPILNLPQHSIV